MVECIIQMSTVSLMSESSQEVSRYMNRTAVSYCCAAFMVTFIPSLQGARSAGYSRLRQGIRGTGGYPTAGRGGANQQGPPGHS